MKTNKFTEIKRKEKLRNKLIREVLEIVKSNKGTTTISSVCSYANCNKSELGFYLSDHPEYRPYVENSIDKLKDDYYTNQIEFLQDDKKTQDLLNKMNNLFG